MAEGDIIVFDHFMDTIFSAGHDFDSDAVKAALMVGWTPDQTADEVWADISANEISGTNYTAGGEVATVAVSISGHVLTFDVSNPLWSQLDAGTPTQCVFVNTSSTGSILMFTVEVTKASNGGDYSVDINANGVFSIDFS